MPHLVRPGATVHYSTFGASGAWVTLINGYTRTSRDFFPFTRSLTKAGFRVLLVDNRGSELTKTDRAFLLKDIADDIAAVCKECSIARTHLLGISFGGIASAFTAFTHPSLLATLTLVSTPCETTGGDPGSDPTRYFGSGFAERNAPLIEGFRKQIERAKEKPDLAQGALWQRDSMKKISILPWMKKIPCPVLIVHGRDDLIVPFASAEKTKAHSPSSRLEILPGVGHLILIEAPNRLLELITQFWGAEIKPTFAP